MEGRCLKVKNECKVMEDLENESYENGARKAAFDVAVRYYRKGLISIEKAAEDAGMRREDFAALAVKTSSYANTSDRPIPVCKGIQ